MTKFPFGSFWVMIAATVRFTLSERSTLPDPLVELLDPRLVKLDALTPLGKMLARLPSAPRKFVRLESSDPDRDRSVLLSI